jgi:hypothetical protein
LPAGSAGILRQPPARALRTGHDVVRTTLSYT